MPAGLAAVVQAKCGDCHAGDDAEAGVRLDGAWSAERLLTAEGAVWFRALHEIESARMPPQDSDQPSAAERAALAGWIRGDLEALAREHRLRVGRGQLRRLSREEYANTVFDLLGFRPPVRKDLPEDGRVDGYQKVAKALPLSAAGLEGYLLLADKICDAIAIRTGPSEPGPVKRYDAQPNRESKGNSLELDDGWHVFFNSTLSSGPFKMGTASPGRYRLRISTYGYQTDQPLPFGVYAGHTSAYPQIVELIAVLDAPPGKPGIVETEVYLSNRVMNDRAGVGDGIRLVPFGLGEPVPKNGQASVLAKGKPGLALQWIELQQISGPPQAAAWLTADFSPQLMADLKGPGLGRPANKLKGTSAEEVTSILEQTFRRVAPRFFRRDLAADEREAIEASIRADVAAGKTVAEVFRRQLRGLLVSPDFFCIIEEPGPLSDFAVASRLSYFLWNSTPDEQLLDLARAGRLRDPAILREQTDRMLADPKAERFVKDFAAQWLWLSAINDTKPDERLFPEYYASQNDLLTWASVAETEHFLKLMIDENASVREIVDSRRVLANALLARHYGLPEVAGSELRELTLPDDSPYGGLWTQPAIMKVTANGTNTSPVKRGVWVAERLLGVHIPPPPPNVDPIATDTSAATSLKQQLALHSGNGSCAACHAKFDGYGFALESFDVIGAHRDFYRVATPKTVDWKGPASAAWGEAAGAISDHWKGGLVPGAFDPVLIAGTASGTITYDKPLYPDAAGGLSGLAIGNSVAGEITRLVTAADCGFRRVDVPGYRQVLVGPGGHWEHRAGSGLVSGALHVTGGELAIEGGSMTVLGSTRIGAEASPGLVRIGSGGRVDFRGGLVLGPAATLRVVLGDGPPAAILAGSNRKNADVELGGRLEAVLPAGAEAVGGQTFTVVARGKGGPPITGTFASTGVNIARVDYSDDAVTVTLVDKPVAGPPAAGPAADPPARLDAAGLVAAQQPGKPGRLKGRPTWRSHLPVDSSGTLPDGRPFADISALRTLLAGQPERLAAGVAGHLVTYATGVRPVGADSLAVEALADLTKADDHGLRSLIHAVIQSDLFLAK